MFFLTFEVNIFEVLLLNKTVPALRAGPLATPGCLEVEPKSRNRPPVLSKNPDLGAPQPLVGAHGTRGGVGGFRGLGKGSVHGPSRRNIQYFRSTNPTTFPTSASRDSVSDQPAKGIPAVNPAAGSGIVFHDL